MANLIPNLQINVSLVNGTTQRFGQDDRPLLHEIIDSIHPAKLFSSPHIVIADTNRLVLFRTEHVVRVELISDTLPLPEWPYLQDALSVHEVPRALFDQRFDPEAYAVTRRDAWTRSDREHIGFTEIHTLDNQSVIWEVRMRSKPLLSCDVIPMITSLLGADGMHARLSNRGVAIINPANITFIAFYPGPPEVPGQVWHANQINQDV
jgi:hypothetical protein